MVDYHRVTLIFEFFHFSCVLMKSLSMKQATCQKNYVFLYLRKISADRERRQYLSKNSDKEVYFKSTPFRKNVTGIFCIQQGQGFSESSRKTWHMA